MKMTNKIITAFLIFWAMTAIVRAEEKVAEFSEETKEVCNQVMINIYKDILKVKNKYPELKNFDENALHENQLGIYTIIYKDSRPEMQNRKTPPFEMGLTIDKIKDATFAGKPNNFNFSFPLLGLKFSGYYTKRYLRSQYDVVPVVNQHGTILEDYQQQFVPLKLTVKTPKSIYKVREDIEFEITLKNVSNRHMRVKSLGMNTLFFVIGDMVWGTSPASKQRGGEDVVLRSGESLTLKFKGESFQKPRDVQIYCSYRMSIRGVNPSDTLRIKVVENQ